MKESILDKLITSKESLDSEVKELVKIEESLKVSSDTNLDEMTAKLNSRKRNIDYFEKIIIELSSGLIKEKVPLKSAVEILEICNKTHQLKFLDKYRSDENSMYKSGTFYVLKDGSIDVYLKRNSHNSDRLKITDPKLLDIVNKKSLIYTLEEILVEAESL